MLKEKGVRRGLETVDSLTDAILEQTGHGVAGQGAFTTSITQRVCDTNAHVRALCMTLKAKETDEELAARLDAEAAAEEVGAGTLIESEDGGGGGEGKSGKVSPGRVRLARETRRWKGTQAQTSEYTQSNTHTLAFHEAQRARAQRVTAADFDEELEGGTSLSVYLNNMLIYHRIIGLWYLVLRSTLVDSIFKSQSIFQVCTCVVHL